MSIPASNSGPVRLALVGAGRWGRNIIRTIAGLPGVALTRLASSNPESLGFVPAGCAVDRDWRTVATAADVDGVIVATPPASHAEIALAAMAAGKAVLIEKPLTLDMAEAEALCRAAAGLGAPVWVEHTQLFNPAWQALKAALPRIGRIRAFRSEAGNHGPYRKGGVPMLWDWGAHDVAMALDLLNADPDSVAARWAARGEREGGEAGDISLTLTFGDVRGVTRLCNTMDKCRRFVVFGQDGTLFFDDLAAVKASLHPPSAGDAWPDTAGEALVVEAEMPLTRAIRCFAEAVRQPAPGPSPLSLGLRVVRVLAACD